MVKTKKSGLIPKNFVVWLNKNFTSVDKIDYKAYYDREISVSENKNIFKEQFVNLWIDKPVKISKKEQSVLEEQSVFESRKNFFIYMILLL